VLSIIPQRRYAGVKTRVAIILAGALLASVLPLGEVSATAGGTGLGIILGEPTGVSFKQWISGGNAVDAAAAWSFNSPGAFHFHMDYLYHRDVDTDADLRGVKFYFGIGGRLKAVEDDSRIGVRVPVGLDYMFTDAPLDLFFEIAPILDLVPATELRINGGFGVRYFF
jgi:hypothetical protein